VKTLASRAAMSVRNFTGVFQREMGMTPADFVETARVDRNNALVQAENLAEVRRKILQERQLV